MISDASSLDSALQDLFGPGIQLESRKAVAGGDINAAFLITLSNGEKRFLKENRSSLVGMFAAEASGLDALAEVASRSAAPPVPRPLAWGLDGNRSFLLMETVATGRGGDGEAFGRALAALHREGRSDNCGFSGDNWIGSTPQPNPEIPSWHEFFAEYRLMHQWQLARRQGYGNDSAEKEMESLCRRLPDLIPPPDGNRPSLLHGDLWGGNWMSGADGRAWLIDPAVYYGHREADLAMTRLFGGFPAGFHRSYNEEWPLESGFDQRVDLYNLYHLLNHLNLFGSSYWGGVSHTLSRYS